MLTKEEFHKKIADGIQLLDGATGSNLQKAGMPRGCCAEEWILSHPEKLVALQRGYAEAGAQIIYAPTFQAQPIALERVNLHRRWVRGRDGAASAAPPQGRPEQRLPQPGRPDSL